MKRIGVLAVGVVVLVVGCFSSDDDTPACTIPGRYSMTGQVLSSSPGCSAIGATVGGQTPQVNMTVSLVADGSYVVSFDTLVGTCPLTKTGTCSTHAICDVSAPGKLDLSWTFGESGFTGTNVGNLSASATIPQGCNYTAAATGTKL